MITRAKVPSLNTKGAKMVMPKTMEIRPKMPGVPRVWTPGAISRRFGSKKDWGKR